jgi:hypothetical protein
MNLFRMIAIRAQGKAPIGGMKDSGATSALVSSAQEDIVRGIRHATVNTRAFALFLQNPAPGIDALNRRGAGKKPVTAMIHNVELEPRNIVRCCAPGTLAAALPFTPLSSMWSQFGPA